jgi:hypothetical protein
MSTNKKSKCGMHGHPPITKVCKQKEENILNEYYRKQMLKIIVLEILLRDKKE